MTVHQNADGSFEFSATVYLNGVPEAATGILAPPSGGLIPGWQPVGMMVEDGIATTSDVGPKSPKWLQELITSTDTWNGPPYVIGKDLYLAEPDKPGDIVAQIDRLVSEEKCPHCGRDWHTRALTRDLLAMYERGRTDPSYFVKEDTSPILCDGSTFIGPLRPAPPARQRLRAAAGECFLPASVIAGGKTPNPVAKAQSMMQGFLDLIGTLTGFDSALPPALPPAFTAELWMPGDPLSSDEASALTEVPDELVVEFGPHNWHLDFQYAPNYQQASYPPPWFPMSTPKQMLTYKIGDLWGELNAVPVPAPKPYDWSQIQTSLTPPGFPQYPTMKGHKK